LVSFIDIADSIADTPHIHTQVSYRRLVRSEK
jgi:hypothetical protein